MKNAKRFRLIGANKKEQNFFRLILICEESKCLEIVFSRAFGPSIYLQSLLTKKPIVREYRDPLPFSLIIANTLGSEFKEKFLRLEIIDARPLGKHCTNPECVICGITMCVLKLYYLDADYQENYSYIDGPREVLNALIFTIKLGLPISIKEGLLVDFIDNKPKKSEVAKVGAPLDIETQALLEGMGILNQGCDLGDLMDDPNVSISKDEGSTLN